MCGSAADMGSSLNVGSSSHDGSEPDPAEVLRQAELENRLSPEGWMGATIRGKLLYCQSRTIWQLLGNCNLVAVVEPAMLQPLQADLVVGVWLNFNLHAACCSQQVLLV